MKIFDGDIMGEGAIVPVEFAEHIGSITMMADDLADGGIMDGVAMDEFDEGIPVGGIADIIKLAIDGAIFMGRGRGLSLGNDGSHDYDGEEAEGSHENNLRKGVDGRKRKRYIAGIYIMALHLIFEIERMEDGRILTSVKFARPEGALAHEAEVSMGIQIAKKICQDGVDGFKMGAMMGQFAEHFSKPEKINPSN